MLAPFAPLADADKVVGDGLAKLASPCLLAGTGLPIQKPSRQTFAHIRRQNDSGLIQEGDHVILFATRDNIDSIIIKKGGTFDSRHGHFLHNDLIGKPYGSRLYAKKNGKGYVTAIRPTSELWTLGCNHRTEILYLSDISMILANLGVKPGSLVIETGTGTGSLSTAFITALQPYGRLYTFEYHDARAAGAAQDFERNGLTPWVTVTHRDTIRTGFPAELDGVIDAVFLDLPAPWEVVPAAKKALKHDAPFCSFSPCIEQIQATAEKLAECGFVKIETVECLQKAYDVRTMPIQKDLDDWSIESPLNPFPSVNTKKRQRADPESTEKDMSKEAVEAVEAVEATSSKQIREPLIRSVSRNRNIEEGEEEMFKLVSRPFPEMRGHTGYLIFARNYSLAPRAPRSVSAPPVASSSMDSMP